ncbi:cysteine-rich RLK (RECEPTOR-like protein kinase) 8 [Euphorbia peplus]|nr:cysteine-rich RLK (RECEPTOR-like protein kinase) 8 [Euphorbia peplus]
MRSVAFVSLLEPKDFYEAEDDEFWLMAMQEELDQFKRSEVWTLVPRPKGQKLVGTKWVLKNKLDELGNLVRNKATLVAQGYSQQEGIDYGETFAYCEDWFSNPMMKANYELLVTPAAQILMLVVERIAFSGP